MTYQGLKDLVDNFNVINLESEIGRNLPNPRRDGAHHTFREGGKDTGHLLDCYQVLVKEYFVEDNPKKYPIPEASLVFTWKYCPSCKKIRNKNLVGFHRQENCAYVKELINKGVEA